MWGVSMTLRTSKVAALLLLSVHLLHASALPAASSYEFNAYRMQQYNLHQDKHGCRGAIVVAEARSAVDTSLTRRCVIMKLPDFSTERYLEAKKQNAAAVLILLPQNISSVPEDIVQGFMVAESQVLQKETLMPVYVVPEDDQLLCMYEEVTQAAATKSASVLVRVLRSIITTTAFQILVSNNSPIQPITDTTIITLEGVLPGAGEDPPTIVITAHYDSFGLAPVSHTHYKAFYYQEFKHYLRQVHRHTFHPDRRDPEITFFDQMKQPMMMYRVKPATFDLFLGGCIAGYLGIVYYAIQTFGNVYTKLKATVKAKNQ
ncbi:nicalin-like [Sinocyclocheilus grahami]|uniref:nicalin-like n=1 Tax=Sinocyclocheilus grahami TaxID=75366 RepID=UPI0007AD19D0|nr:PREDICTED: nicalin-like [Sinocyclocheilus grahami]